MVGRNGAVDGNVQQDWGDQHTITFCVESPSVGYHDSLMKKKLVVELDPELYAKMSEWKDGEANRLSGGPSSVRITMTDAAHILLWAGLKAKQDSASAVGGG